MNVFVQVILPILIVFTVGYLLQRNMRLNISSISTLAMYVLTPCLVFRTFYEAEFDLQYAYMVLFFLLFFASMMIISIVYVKLRKRPKSHESAYILSTGFMNAGNYGSPILLLAYGPIGFDYAISFFLIQSVSLHSIGLYFASRGKMSWKAAVVKVLRMPMIYAVITAFVLRSINVSVPDNLYVMVDFFATAAIPLVMLVLGMQLAETRVKDFDWEGISVTTAIRLFASPAIAYGLTLLFPFDPLMAKVLILQASMPSAIVATMYAVQFDAEPTLVSGTTLVNTLLSIGTITLLLILLG